MASSPKNEKWRCLYHQPLSGTLCEAGLVFFRLTICMSMGKHEAVIIDSSDHVAFSVFTFIKQSGYSASTFKSTRFSFSFCLTFYLLHICRTFASSPSPPPTNAEKAFFCSRTPRLRRFPLRQIYLKWKNPSCAVWGLKFGVRFPLPKKYK